MIKTFEQYETSESEKPLAQVQINAVLDNCKCILAHMDSLPDDLPAWVQDKISVTNHNMDAICKWIESNNL